MKRKEAAKKIYDLQKNLECKPVALTTVYRKLVKLFNGNWHYSGTGYDYTV